jgi:hypothetical protein
MITRVAAQAAPLPLVIQILAAVALRIAQREAAAEGEPAASEPTASARPRRRRPAA